MTPPGSVSHWLAALKEGDPAAARPLWERYYRRLVALARERLDAGPRRAADEEDVVQNAFHSFFRAAAEGGAWTGASPSRSASAGRVEVLISHAPRSSGRPPRGTAVRRRGSPRRRR